MSAAPDPAAETPEEAGPPAKGRIEPRKRYPIVGAAATRLSLVAALSPPALLGHLTVFALAIGYYVIGHVHHALHTPLMSVTNAISGVIVTGTLLQVGRPESTNDASITGLAFVGILMASINVFGGLR